MAAVVWNVVTLRQEIKAFPYCGRQPNPPPYASFSGGDDLVWIVSQIWYHHRYQCNLQVHPEICKNAKNVTWHFGCAWKCSKKVISKFTEVKNKKKISLVIDNNHHCRLKGLLVGQKALIAAKAHSFLLMRFWNWWTLFFYFLFRLLWWSIIEYLTGISTLIMKDRKCTPRMED